MEKYFSRWHMLVVVLFGLGVIFTAMNAAKIDTENSSPADLLGATSHWVNTIFGQQQISSKDFIITHTKTGFGYCKNQKCIFDANVTSKCSVKLGKDDKTGRYDKQIGEDSCVGKPDNVPAPGLACGLKSPNKNGTFTCFADGKCGTGLGLTCDKVSCECKKVAGLNPTPVNPSVPTNPNPGGVEVTTRGHCAGGTSCKRGVDPKTGEYNCYKSVDKKTGALLYDTCDPKNSK